MTKSKENLLITAAVIGSMLLVIWGVSYAISRGTCAWYGSQTERDTRYAAFVGCMVRVDDHWVPRAELRTAP